MDGTMYVSYRCFSFSVLRPGFTHEVFSGNEGPDRRSSLPNMPCAVTISLQNGTFQAPLTFWLIPRTVSENIDANGPPPTATLTGTSASSKNIIESVDSICRNSADTQYMLIQTNFSKCPKQLTYKPL